MRFSSKSGTTSATVPSAASRIASSRNSRSGGVTLALPHAFLHSAHASLNATPAPDRPPNGYDVAGQTRMHQGRRARQRLLRLVMIGDDQLHAEPGRLVRFVEAGDAAIDGDDDVGAVLGELLQRLVVEAVAVVEAVRHVELDLGIEQVQAGQQDRGRGDAVHVVVAVDADLLLVLRSPPGGVRPRRRRRAAARVRAARSVGSPGIAPRRQARRFAIEQELSDDGRDAQRSDSGGRWRPRRAARDARPWRVSQIVVHVRCGTMESKCVVGKFQKPEVIRSQIAETRFLQFLAFGPCET